VQRPSRLVLCALFTAASVFADGGTLLLRRDAGPYSVSLFASPEPLRPGPADLSVMLQKTSDRSSVLDAKVSLRLSQKSAGTISEIFARASHERATNKLLYAATVNIPQPGRWQLAVDVEDKTGTAELATAVTVQPREAPAIAHWPYLILVPVLAALFILNRWLKVKRRSERPLVPH
jgi:hypothetical protein